MNLLSLVGSRLYNIYQIRRKSYYSSDSKYLQSKRGLNLYDYSPIVQVLPSTSINTCTRQHLNYRWVNIQIKWIWSFYLFFMHLKPKHRVHSIMTYLLLRLYWNSMTVHIYLYKIIPNAPWLLGCVHFSCKPKIFPLPPVTSNIWTHAWSIKYR
jgi:hypothetical protein